MPEGETFEILVLNDISQVGLERFPAERYPRGELAYTRVDIVSAAPHELPAQPGKIDGVPAVRYLPLRS